MQEIECEGKTVADAVENALKKAGLRRDQVEVQILQEASAGFIGIGARPARVMIREKRWAADGSEPPAGAPQPARGRPAHPSPANRPPRPAPARQKERPQEPQRRPAREPAPAAAPAREPVPAAPARGAGETSALCAQAETMLREVLPLLRIEGATVKVSWDSQQERVKADVEAPDAERLIGRDGRTLESLQFLLTLILTRKSNGPVAVWVDAQGYWQKKEQSLLAEAQKGVESVRATGKPYRMPPMDAAQRRLIHRSLADNPEVSTASEGEGTWRKIVLKPKHSR